MKILMALMGLEIGGAETHVVELSKELKRRGHDIVVVSNGGVYENELEAFDIKCLHAPLHKRNAFLMYKSYKALEKIITEEKPDIVHAHARIPAYICGLLQNKYHFKFVTSAHWVFKVNSYLRKLTNWGDKTIAVSDDIKAYLMDNYSVPEENITVTVNGIDTDKFSKDVSKEAAAEIGVDTTKPVLLYVSRLDEDRSLAARQLLDIADKLKNKIEGLQIVVVGDGNDFEYIKRKADECNKKSADKYVFMTGARSDINKLVSLADVFIGVSRSALEAMSAEKLVILAGNEGFLGLFDENKKDIAAQTNYCLRGCAMPDQESLYNEIVKAFLLDAEEKISLGKLGRDNILNNYSTKKMADDCESCYNSLS